MSKFMLPRPCGMSRLGGGIKTALGIGLGVGLVLIRLRIFRRGFLRPRMQSFSVPLWNAAALEPPRERAGPIPILDSFHNIDIKAVIFKQYFDSPVFSCAYCLFYFRISVRVNI